MGRSRARVPDDILDALRWRCLALPEAVEEEAWVGTRWTVRGKNFAHVLMIDEGWPPAYARAAGIDGSACVLTFRSSRVRMDPDAFERPPFFRPLWWPDIAGMRLDGGTDWKAVSTLLEASYMKLAPRKLAAQAAGPRPAAEGEIDALARLWFDGWRDAHAALLPAELARHRTIESFAARLGEQRSNAVAIGPAGAPLGFYLLDGDELNQLYVGSEARGTGVAAALIEHAEARLGEAGVETAWLACAIGNDRAARFYEKRGWNRSGTVVSRLPTPDGIVELDVWRYEKRLRPPATAPRA